MKFIFFNLNNRYYCLHISGAEIGFFRLGLFIFFVLLRNTCLLLIYSIKIKEWIWNSISLVHAPISSSTWTKRCETTLFAQAVSETDRYILKNLEDAGTPAGHYIVSALLSRRKVISSPNLILNLFTNPSSFIFSTLLEVRYCTRPLIRRGNTMMQINILLSTASVCLTLQNKLIRK